ncbi:hypothetical protein L6164_022074 [Bauhinia variegata]|uniref:Uncharacterized protein n=1 Tax=Bauhinia variegata TaxID=167791 RepID=A0ACB9MEF8_BAUVA|nr:hypothetical protein L6164_022074 [Bauhinia variegata]
MTFEIVYQRRKKRNGSTETQWIPETPAKANVIQKNCSDGLASGSEPENKNCHDFNTSADHDTKEESPFDTKAPDNISSLECVDFGIQAPGSKDTNDTLCIDFGIQTPGQKGEKDSTYMNGRLRKKRKKKYWPKVVGQCKRKKVAEPKLFSKKTETGKAKRSPKPKTQKHDDEYIPRPSTPIPKRSNLKRRATSCKRSLIFDLENSSESMKAFETASSSFDQSATNDLGFKYNSLQVYESRFLGSLCPNLSSLNVCKKKRSTPRRKRIPARLSSCIRSTWSIRKKKRSKGYTIKRSNYLLAWAAIPMCNQISVRSSSCGFQLVPKVVQLLSKKFLSLKIGDKVKRERKTNKKKGNEIIPYKEPSSKIKKPRQGKKTNPHELVADKQVPVPYTIKLPQQANLNELAAANQIVPYKIRKNRARRQGMEVNLYEPGANNQVVPYKIKKPRQITKVILDEESIRVWKLLRDGKDDEEMDSEKQKYWERERNLFKGRIETFIHRMHLVQGNRRFSPWKGSVLDSVIGVYLTQNVSDYLSSNAYMSLAARFPVEQKTSCYCDSNCDSNEDRETPSRQESVESNHISDERRKTSQEAESNTFDEMKSQSQKFKESSDFHDPLRINKTNHSRKLESPGIIFGKTKSAVSKKTKKAMGEEEKDIEEKEKLYWEELRKTFTKSGMRDSNHMDSINWEAVMQAGKEAVAEAIECRGQHNVNAVRILAFLNKLKEMHGNVDIEWLRYAPPQKVKEYLLKVYGLGLKSVECIRLLALQHVAFPVDVNVSRIATRLGWVPLEPLPEHIKFHALDHANLALPAAGTTLDERSTDSANLALPAETTSEERFADKNIVTSFVPNFTMPSNRRSTSISEVNSSTPQNQGKECQCQCEPIIEMPPSPEPLIEHEIEDIEDFFKDTVNIEKISNIDLNDKKCVKEHEFLDDDVTMNKSKALIALTVDATSIPAPKLKAVSRLRTQRLVYELPDTSSLLEGFEKRECDDPCNFLFAIWTRDEIKNQSEDASNSRNNSDLSDNNVEEEEKLDSTVPGTILIPCRTAMKGRFPLNGTYFQVNEVFADDYSSRHPINVPRKLLWTLERRIVYFGTSISSILKGYICVRGFDRKTGAPRPLLKRFHISTANTSKKKNDSSANKSKKKNGKAQEE